MTVRSHGDRRRRSHGDWRRRSWRDGDGDARGVDDDPQSLGIGVAFLPNIGTYVFGFCGAAAAPLTRAWALCALPIAAATPLSLALRGRLLPEDWRVFHS